MAKKEKRFKVVSLFSGCGGLDLGFINAGFEVVWATDFFPDAVNTYKKNIGEHIVLGDITKIPSSEIPDDRLDDINELPPIKAYFLERYGNTPSLNGAISLDSTSDNNVELF